MTSAVFEMFQPFSRSLPTRNARSAFSLNSRSVPAFEHGATFTPASFEEILEDLRADFASDMTIVVPAGVTVHVLPAGADSPPGVDLSQLRYRDTSRVDEHIRRAYEASAAYLAEAAQRTG